jgi:hypothetical protein
MFGPLPGIVCVAADAVPTAVAKHRSATVDERRRSPVRATLDSATGTGG